jgi:hypothetical protein
MIRDGLWIQTTRGLEPISPGFLAEILKKYVPKLRPSTLRELSSAAWELLNNQSFPSTPFNLTTLSLELSHLLAQLGQTGLAEALALPIPKETGSLFGAFGEAIDSGLFTQLGDNQTPYQLRWDLVHQGMPPPQTHLLILEVPDPQIPGDAFDLWLSRVENLLETQKGDVCFFWNPRSAAEPSLFHLSLCESKKSMATLEYEPFLEVLSRHASRRIRVLVGTTETRETGTIGSCDKTWGQFPEGIQVGTTETDYPGKVSNLSSRVEIQLQHLARMRQDPVNWLVKEASNLRNPGGPQSLALNPLAPSVRWVLRGWIDPRGAILLEQVWAVLQKLWPARDEIMLGWEKGLPTEPFELERLHEQHPILNRLEEIRHPLLWPQPEAWARLRNLGFKGPIWQTGF